MIKKKTVISSKKTNFIVLLLLTLLLIIIFCILNAMSQKNWSTNINTQDSGINSKHQNSSDWTKYSNKNYNFSIKYPNDLLLEENKGGNEMPPSAITQIEPSFVIIKNKDSKKLNISINPEGYFGYQYSGEKKLIDQTYIDGKLTNIFIKTDPTGYYSEKLYQVTGLNNLPDFSIVANLHINENETLNQIISTLKFND